MAGAKNNSQKNEGVYFEYEAVDPDAAEEIIALQEEDEAQFSWAQRSRDTKKAFKEKIRSLNGAPARQRTGAKRGSRWNDTAAARLRRQAAADAAAATASPGPVMPGFSPVETPAMRARATTPEELLIRPDAVGPKDPRVASPPPPPPPPVRPAASKGLASSPVSTSATAAEDRAEISSSSSSSSVSGSNRHLAADTATPAGVSSRRQRLLKRMKGETGGAAAAAVATAAAASAAPVVVGSGTVLGSAAVPKQQEEKGGAAQEESVAQQEKGAGTRGPTVAAGAVAAAAAATTNVGSGSPALGADLRSQLASLAAQLPPEADLPEEARQARQLLATILSPSPDDVREVTAGDVSDMLTRDLSAAREFAEWLRRARVGRGVSEEEEEASTAAGGEDAGSRGAEDFIEAEGADLMAALANLDLEGDLAGFGADLDVDLDLDLGLDGMGDGSEGGNRGGGDAAVCTAVRQVSELRELMAQLDADDGATAATTAEKGGGADMTDEQVLQALKASDPALYELLKDVPEFDKLDLDLDLDLNLDLEKLTKEELAALTAEAEAAAGAPAAGGDEEADLEALLRDMRGMGLMEGAANNGDDAEEDEGNEDDLALGDLLEAIGEDEELDTSSRLRAQFALQSMFNQPADELAAKGTRGSGAISGEDDVTAPQRLPPRGTTGMAREAAVSADDEDGGAAPPPVLPKPKPRPRSSG